MHTMNFMTSFYSNLKISGREDRNIYSSITFSINKLIIVPLTVLLLLTSCEEDPSSIGRGILPGSDFDSIKSTDTLSLRLYTRFDTSVSKNPSTSFLGTLQDPFFGQTKSDFITQLWLYESWPEQGFIKVDSTKISIVVSDLMGTLTTGSPVLGMVSWEPVVVPPGRHPIHFLRRRGAIASKTAKSLTVCWMRNAKRNMPKQPTNCGTKSPKEIPRWPKPFK